MITVFDLSRCTSTNHHPSQFDQFSHIEFEFVIAHPHLYVADVTKEESLMLVLLGCDIDHTIATNPKEIVEGKTRMIYKGADGDGYTIMRLHYTTIPFDK